MLILSHPPPDDWIQPKAEALLEAVMKIPAGPRFSEALEGHQARDETPQTTHSRKLTKLSDGSVAGMQHKFDFRSGLI
ncbi:MAG: hypothetical protein ABSF67_24360 [Roseiarcus sp.]